MGKPALWPAEQHPQATHLLTCEARPGGEDDEHPAAYRSPDEWPAVIRTPTPLGLDPSAVTTWPR